MGTIKLVLGFGVIVAAVLFGIAFIPPYFANYQFEDQLKTEALAATYTTRTEEEIKTVILRKAKDLDIPLEDKQVKVVRTGNMGTGTLSITADYTIPVSMPGYQTSLEFHASSSNKGVY